MCINCGSTGCGGCQPAIPTSPAGAAGKNAFTLTTASFTMPAVDANVTITVSTTGQYGNAWAKALQVIAITGAGYFQVVSTTGNNQITITNLGYAGNASPAATIAAGATVAPAGIRGIQGAAGAAGTNGTTRLYELLSPSTSGTTGSFQAFAAYTVPANTLVNNGDALVISGRTTQTASVTFPNLPKRRITFSGDSCTITGGIEPIMLTPNSGTQYNIQVELIKSGAATALCKVSADITYASGAVQTLIYQVDLSSQDFTIANALQLDIFQYTAAGTELNSFTVDKIAS